MAEDESEKTEEKGNEEIKESYIDKIASAISHVWARFSSAISHVWARFSRIRDKSPKLSELDKKIPSNILTLGLALGTFSMALGTWRLSESNKKLVNYTRRANDRAEQLFIGQSKPLVDVIPIGIVQTELKDEKKTKMCTTLFSYVNYSGFKVTDIAIDIKYGDNVWISDWVNANIDSDRKKKDGDGKEENLDLNHWYISRRKIAIPELKPGQIGRSDLERSPLYASGELDLKVNVVDKKEGFPILVRVTWKNKYKHVFEKINKYKLVCTTTGIGHAFTFIHEGIVSQTH